MLPESKVADEAAALRAIREDAAAATAAVPRDSMGVPPSKPQFPNPAAPEPRVDHADMKAAAIAEEIPPHGLIEDDQWTAAPVPVESDIRIWTGTWNLGAKDPFHKKDITKSMDLVTRTLEKFVPLDYDVYVVGL